jgi:hypothetical protein
MRRIDIGTFSGSLGNGGTSIIVCVLGRLTIGSQTSFQVHWQYFALLAHSWESIFLQNGSGWMMNRTYSIDTSNPLLIVSVKVGYIVLKWLLMAI